jgi:SNF2 family DNA or RNA helicase
MALGLGKTTCALTAMSDLMDGYQARKVLIVAPLRVAKETWPAELRKWEHVSHLKGSVICGDPKQRQAALRTGSLHFINVENLVWLESWLGSRWDYDVMILDESSGYKNQDTKRWKCARRLSRKTERMILMSATPAPNSLVDLWAQVYLLDGGQRLGQHVTHFRNKYFRAVDKDGRKWKPRRGAEAIIYKAIEDITLVMQAEDYLSMPDKFILEVPVDIGEEARKAYTDFEKDCVAALPGGEVEAFTAAALLGKLTQFSNGHVYDAEKNVHVIHDAKLDALVELIEEAQEPVLVGYTFQSDRDRILQRLPHAEVIGKDMGVIARWNKGEIPVLIAHPASAGHGLNLQHGGRHLVWFGPPWSLELYLQMNGRLHRQGQERPVMIHHLIATGTVDETIMAVLSGKNASQQRLLDALSIRLRK